MKLNVRNLEPLGFKWTGLFKTQTSIGLFYRVRADRVEFVSSYPPGSFGYFILTSTQLRQFRAGKLALVPPGFCAPGLDAKFPKLENATLLKAVQPIRNRAQLEQLFP